MSKSIVPFSRPLSTRGKVLAALLAGCCAVVLYSRVYLDFQRVRVSLVREETVPAGGSVLVPLPDLSGLEGQATAIIIRLANEQPEPMSVTVLVGNNQLARFVVGPQRVARVDLSVGDGAQLATADRLEIRGDGDR